MDNRTGSDRTTADGLRRKGWAEAMHDYVQSDNANLHHILLLMGGAGVIKSFKVGCSRTINLGNFQSIRVEALVEIEVDPDLTPERWAETKKSAQADLRQLLEETYRAQHKDKP